MGVASSVVYIPLLFADLEANGLTSKSIELQATLILLVILGFTGGYLFETNQRKKTDYHTLYRLTRSMTNNVLPRKIYNDFLKIALKTMSANRGVILIKDNNYFDVKSICGYKEDEKYLLKTFNSEPQSTILNLVYSTGKNLVVNNPILDPRFAIPSDQRSKCGQFIILPISGKNTKLGVILIEGKRNNSSIKG